jgi:hypothetical protein
MVMNAHKVGLAIALLLSTLACSREDQARTAELAKLRAELDRVNLALTEHKTRSEAEIKQRDRQLTQAERNAADLKQCVADAQAQRVQLGDLGDKLSTAEKGLVALNEQYAEIVKTKNELQVFKDTAQASKTEDIWLVFHYWRQDGNYDDWGIVAKGAAVLKPGEWQKPKRFKEQDDFGVMLKVKLHPDFYTTDKAQFFLRNNEGDRDAVSSGMRNKVMSLGPVATEIETGKFREVWIIGGDPSLYTDASSAIAAKRQMLAVTALADDPEPSSSQ